MSIERSQLSDSVGEARKTDGDRRTGREPAQPESSERFRNLMQSRQEARDEFSAARFKGAGDLDMEQRGQAQGAARQAATADAVEAGRQFSGDSEQMRQSNMDPAEVLAMLQAQTALRDGGQAAPVAPLSSNPAAFADLVERHLRQLAVAGGNSAGDRDGQVLLRMADATLPGTDLMLSKTADGWLLRADVRSRDSYDAIREAAPELAKRFAERNLGTLQIDPQFHG